jgi:hypothetical protein
LFQTPFSQSQAEAEAGRREISDFDTVDELGDNILLLAYSLLNGSS